MAWGFLTLKQQNDANAKADMAIAQWELQNLTINSKYSLFIGEV
jgi:hypothetical protein